MIGAEMPIIWLHRNQLVLFVLFTWLHGCFPGVRRPDFAVLRAVTILDPGLQEDPKPAADEVQACVNACMMAL